MHRPHSRPPRPPTHTPRKLGCIPLAVCCRECALDWSLGTLREQHRSGATLQQGAHRASAFRHTQIANSAASMRSEHEIRIAK